MKVIMTVAIVLLGVGGSLLAQGYDPYYRESRASTVGESHARGLSDMVRSKGQYNLETSQAAINMTEVQKRNMENREQWTNTYFQMRKTNKAYRAAERRPRASMADLVRFAQAGKPAPMTSRQLDSVTGKISWPIILQADRYATYRSELQSLFATRANHGGVSLDDHLAIGKTTKATLAALKKQVREVPQTDYIASRKFLKSLAYEARVPTG